MFKIKNIKLRCILNSNADEAVEADLFLNDGSFGRGSSPSAIIPGKREKKNTKKYTLLNLDIVECELKKNLIGQEMEQQSLDNCLKILMDRIGSDISLAISLAFARAAANALKLDFIAYLSKHLQRNLNSKIPQILVPIFSGGVHAKNSADSFQQIMICMKENMLDNEYKMSKELSYVTEKVLEEKGTNFSIAASGGYIVESLSTLEKLELLQIILKRANYSAQIEIAVDVAAEHLQREHKYFFDGKIMSPDEFLEILKYCATYFPICYIEDPFITEDMKYWIKLRNFCGEKVQIIGDDLFATQASNINPMLADGIVIKMNQVGNLTDTIATIKKAREKDMILCVSHRSYETEDISMCDLAVAAAAEYIKIGGVKRGERIIKYNQLLRLKEMMEVQ